MEYAVELKFLSRHCNYGDFLDDALRDRFVCGLYNAVGIQKVLLETKKLSFQKACTVAQTMELAESNSKLISRRAGEFGEVHQVHTKKRSSGRRASSHASSRASSDASSGPKVASGQASNSASSHKSHGSRHQRRHPSDSRPSAVDRPASGHSASQGREYGECYRCGRRHDIKLCPAKDWRCFNCQRLGHVSRKCKSDRVVKKVGEDSECESCSESESSEDEQSSYEFNHITHVETIGMVRNTGALKVKMWIEDRAIEFEVDSGAAGSIVSEAVYRKYLNHLPCKPSPVRLKSVLGETIQILGKVNVLVSDRSKKNRCVLPLIVSRNNVIPSLMGRTWLDKFMPNWRDEMNPNTGEQLNAIRSIDQIVENLKKEFPIVFCNKGQSYIKGFEANVVLKENSTPIFHSAYTVPYALRGSVEQELRRLESSGS